jgi:hypothetical protein
MLAAIEAGEQAMIEYFAGRNLDMGAPVDG